jgi:radical SAM superfamily enzyme YgiQ (UPF0313 family)
MVDVLLSHSNHLFYDRKQVEKMQPYPPLQTLLAAAVLRESGFRVGLCDVTFDAPEEALPKSLNACSPGMLLVCEDDFNFLSKMCLSRNRQVAFGMAKAAKARGIPAAAHGCDSSDHPARYLEAGFDYVLIGEVESTLLELAKGYTPEEIAGLAFRDGQGAVRYNDPRVLRRDLDSLPMPARDLVDMRPYRDAWQSAHGYFSMNMVSSRGCPYQCNWCSKPIWGDSYHVRSARLIAEEMLAVKRHYAPGHIWFADDIFALSSKWTLEFAAAVESLGASIPFKMQSRCDLMTRETVRALKQAGCAEVWMGAESGSQKILDAMDKGLKVEATYAARQNLRLHGIRACLFVQLGYPGEAWTEIQETIRMVRQLQPDDIGVSVSYPLPGTNFHKIVSAQLGAKTNWTDSADLAMMFQGAYSSDFYRALADALHLEVRQPYAIDAIRCAWDRVYALEGSAARARVA